MKFNLFSESSRCRLHLSPNVHFYHLPKAGSQLPGSLIALQAFSSKDGDVDQRNDMPSSIPAPSFSPPLVTTPPLEEDWFSPFKTLTQLWAIILPLGYAGVPLAAQALSQLLPGGSGGGGPSIAAFSGEALALTAVLLFLRYKNSKIQFEFNLQSVGYGFAAGVAALLLNQLLVTASGGGGVDQGTATATSEVAGILLSNNSNPAATLALFTASALLAPATEEIVYRGFFLNSLTEELKISPVIAVGVSAVAFSAAHLQPDVFLQLLLVGLCLGSASVLSKGNVLAPFIGHATYNSALFLSLLFTKGL
jgi:membrane protease YdiL (CAAX protease family)